MNMQMSEEHLYPAQSHQHWFLLFEFRFAGQLKQFSLHSFFYTAF